MTITTRLEQRVARNIDRPETHDVGFERRDRIGRRRGRRGDSGPNFHSTAAPDSAMTKAYTVPSIDEYLRERLMPVEGAIPHISGIEMFGNSIPAGTVGGDLFEYINFQQRCWRMEVERKLHEGHVAVDFGPAGRTLLKWIFDFV